MININDIDDVPKLIPDESIRFEAKDELKRSAEMNFECSELEYKIRLIPDTNIVMPDKKSLKHNTIKPRLVWLSIAVAAAILVFVMIVTNNKHADFATVPENVSKELSELPKIKSKIVPEIKPKSKIEPLKGKIAENKINISSKKTQTANKSVAEIVENTTDEQNLPTEIFENKNNTSNLENVLIERIASVTVSAEMMKKEKMVFVYKRDYQETPALKAVTGMAIAAHKFAADINTTRQNITQKIDGSKLTNILSRLSLDRGIDREIDKWAKENPDIPFTVFVNYSDESKMTEIYDENGTLIKALFFTNNSLKYRNNKVYHALNN
jgi:predicted RNA-binding protein with PIN domain